MGCRRVHVVVLLLVGLACAGRSDDDDDVNGPAGDSPLDEPGVCEPTCVERRDCCNTQPLAMDCFNNLGSFPYIFECNAGICEQTGCQEDEDCSWLPDTVCMSVDGFGACVPPCDTDEDCEDDDRCVELGGARFCRAQCDADSDCPNISHCEDGRCIYNGCMSDEDCFIFNGGTCQPDGTCSCRTNAECDESFACTPT